jgi:hypothetical protein
MISRKIAALVAASLISSSSIALAQSAQPLSLANSPAVARAGADVEGSSQLHGTALYVLGAIALGLIVWGAIELLSDDNDPSSP